MRWCYEAEKPSRIRECDSCMIGCTVNIIYPSLASQGWVCVYFSVFPSEASFRRDFVLLLLLLVAMDISKRS